MIRLPSVATRYWPPPITLWPLSIEQPGIGCLAQSLLIDSVVKTERNDAVKKTVATNSHSHSKVKSRDNNLYDRCKRGWNWRFVFDATTRDGNDMTAVRQELLFRTPSSIETIVSGYPGGCREDSVAEAIQDEINNLKTDAFETGVTVNEVCGRNFDSIVIGAPLDSAIVHAFAQSLASIRRVVVDGI